MRLLASLCFLALVASTVDATGRFIYYYNPQWYQTGADLGFTAQLGRLTTGGGYITVWMGFCSEGWFYHYFSDTLDTGYVNFRYEGNSPIDTSCCNLGCNGYELDYNGGYFMVNTTGNCGGTVDPNFIPTAEVVSANCVPPYRKVYYYNPSWVNDTVNILFSDGNLPMTACGNGYFYAQVAGSNFVYFSNQVDTDYANTTDNSPYFLAFDSTFALISSPDGSNGTIDLSFYPTPVVVGNFCPSNVATDTTVTITSTATTTVTTATTATETATVTTATTATETATVTSATTATVTVTATVTDTTCGASQVPLQSLGTLALSVGFALTCLLL